MLFFFRYFCTQVLPLVFGDELKTKTVHGRYENGGKRENSKLALDASKIDEIISKYSFMNFLSRRSKFFRISSDFAIDRWGSKWGESGGETYSTLLAKLTGLVQQFKLPKKEVKSKRKTNKKPKLNTSESELESDFGSDCE